MLQLTQCRLPYQSDSKEALVRKVARQIHCREKEIRDLRIVKKSIDARKKPDIFYTYTVTFSVSGEKYILQKNKKNKNLSRIEHKKTEVEQMLEEQRGVPHSEQIVIVGSGPAGLFCAYYLTLCGYRPILIERGAPMEERVRDVDAFWESCEVNTQSNVCFGEGGAGTFSDGKLNTGVSDRLGRGKFVLESFVRFGAKESILYDAKPHIGTDVLRKVIVNLRNEMIERGCRLYFHTKMTKIRWDEAGITGVCAIQRDAGKRERTIDFSCDKLVLAIGHSARDTFECLRDLGIKMSPKPFAVGVRVQHRQEDIDRMQYGKVDKELPAASYKCTGKTSDQRGVYSFCMCPGGYVVNASTEPFGLVVNGMSDVARDSSNANSAIVVSVSPEDFGGDDCLLGVEYQRRIEQAAYRLCDGKIPVQRFEDFKKDRITKSCGNVEPCIKGSWAFENLRKALPKYVINGMIEGMEQFEKKQKGFADGDTLLLGVETRTSSPVRVEREKDSLESVSVRGLYPCGEGAGYAGGIMSAAMDGIKVAMVIADHSK